MYLQETYKEHYEEKKIDDAMNGYYADALKRISTLVSPSVAEPFANILVCAIWEDNKNAIDIANLLNLDQAHFVAIRDDRDGMANLIYDYERNNF